MSFYSFGMEMIYTQAPLLLPYPLNTARRLDLPYELAQAIADYSNGEPAIVEYFVGLDLRSREELRAHLKSISCWKAHDQQTVRHLLNLYLNQR